jgi:hypothetical protein
MSRFAPLTASLGLTLLACAPLAAQKTPNLSGTWVMALDKSDFGPLPAPQSRTDVIEHKASSITVKRTVVGANGETTATIVYGIDGKPYTNHIGDIDATSVLRWDGPVLVVESTLNTPQGEVKAVDRFTLSADGKTLTQARSLSLGDQQATQTIVMVKH